MNGAEFFFKKPSALRKVRHNKVQAMADDTHFEKNQLSSINPHSPEECTDEEKTEFKQIFMMFDTDGSGSIGKDELKQAMIRLGLQADEQNLDELIDEVDQDGNGAIEFTEFCACIKKSQVREKTTKEEVTRQCFEIFDQDGNGVISENEFKYVAMEIGGFDNQLADLIFNELDTCSNGIITADQFTAIVEDYLFSNGDDLEHPMTPSRS